MMELLGTEFRTDYFVMWEREAEIPWCLVHGSTWHILLPHAPAEPWPNILQARPVTSRRNKDHDQWRWRLEIGPWHLPLGDRHFHPFKPALIEKFTTHKRQAVCYCSAKPGTEFARVAHRCPLLLVRDDQKEEPREWQPA